MTTERWKRRVRQRVVYRHHAQRIIERATRRDIEIILSLVPRTEAHKVVVSNLDPSWTSLALATIEEACANALVRYDRTEVLLLGATALLGFLIGFIVALTS